MTKVLIAGATGYLVRFVVQEFKGRGYWIRALARNPERMAAIKSMRLFNRHAADLFDFFATAAQYENVAPQLGTHTPDDYFWALDQAVQPSKVGDLQLIRRTPQCND